MPSPTPFTYSAIGMICKSGQVLLQSLTLSRLPSTVRIRSKCSLWLSRPYLPSASCWLLLAYLQSLLVLAWHFLFHFTVSIIFFCSHPSLFMCCSFCPECFFLVLSSLPGWHLVLLQDSSDILSSRKTSLTSPLHQVPPLRLPPILDFPPKLFWLLKIVSEEGDSATGFWIPWRRGQGCLFSTTKFRARHRGGCQ